MASRVRAPRQVATLGMFIIDQFQYINPENGEDEGDRGLGDQVGGGGTYFTIGARVWLPPADLKMVIDVGDDFPEEVRATLEGFRHTTEPFNPQCNALWHYRRRIDGHGTTRALNIYKGEQRGFKYLTPKMRLDPHHVLYTPDLRAQELGHVAVLPTYIHFICSPERATAICDEVEMLLRDGKARNQERPVLVWEPIPDSAVVENLDECVTVMKRVDVFSPNHAEAASLLGRDRINMTSTHDPEGSPGSVARDAATMRIEIKDVIARRFLELITLESSELDTPFERKRRFGSQGPIVHIRSGALGSLVGHRLVGSRWVSAYHTPREARAGAVKDVTGAGNACLGGFTAALSLHEEQFVTALAGGGDASGTLQLLVECAAYGSVSAAFVIEQLGLPHMEIVDSPDGKEERWNGDTARSRLCRPLS